MSETGDNPSSPRKCARCGAELPAGVPPELCPKCLLKAGLETGPAAGPGGTVVLPKTDPGTRGLPRPGEQLGQYRIVRLLGKGGMGAVLEAEDLDTGRRVALKVLSHTLDSPEARERFFREGRLAAAINHPNSVYIFGTGEIGGTPYITMELVAGGTLQDRVSARGPMPIHEAVDAVLQIIAGLEAARRVGILHRDVKPSNCYVDEAGTVKIGDFGLSISTAIRTEPAITASGAFLGTPGFCSPEQLRGEELNARSDMYSVGATLFYLLTGRTPFEAKNIVQLLATVLEHRAPSPRKFRPQIPHGLAKVILRCLEKQSGDRFKDYDELSKALVPFSSTSPTPATLGLRFAAGFVDYVALSFIGTAVNFAAFRNLTDIVEAAGHRTPKALACMLAGFVMMLLYYAVMEGLWGLTPGKALCRLRVIGRDRNPPGLPRALVRAVCYVIIPMLPMWIITRGDPLATLRASGAANLLLQWSVWIVMILLFSSVRRRNGFAAVHDLITGTRVVSRVALETRPGMETIELPPRAMENKPGIGPYYVLESLGKSDDEEWLLGYDLRLLRKVWIHALPPGTPAVPAALRNIGRPGRLRWLTGRRSANENWDAYEGAFGRPLLHLIQRPQPWKQVRFWMYDLAVELSAAGKDRTMPAVLGLDRVWISGDGRAKLLDFAAPGLEPGVGGSGVPPSRIESAGEPPSAGSAFLSQIATAALSGSPENAGQNPGDVKVPLPGHARRFLKDLSRTFNPEAIAFGLKPLLRRVAEVSRLRRAAVLLGCLALPVLSATMMFLGTIYLQQWNRTNPGIYDLSVLLAQKQVIDRRAAQQENSTRQTGVEPSRKTPSSEERNDHLLSVYIAVHYRATITNDAVWNSAFTQMLIKGEARKFAEQSVAENPSPSKAEIADADAAIKGYVPSREVFPVNPLLILGVSLAFYVAFPACVAALLFRGGLILLATGVIFARKDGARASRLRMFWRALVAWSPLVLIALNSIYTVRHWHGTHHVTLLNVLLLGLFGAVAVLSVALPRRGLPDRLAGTWPVPR